MTNNILLGTAEEEKYTQMLLNIFKKHLCILLFFCCSKKDIVGHSCI